MDELARLRVARLPFVNVPVPLPVPDLLGHPFAFCDESFIVKLQ